MTTLQDLRAEPRPLWQALAHELARTRPGEARLNLLNSLYRDLTPADALRCRAELHAVRAARRGESPAQVSP